MVDYGTTCECCVDGSDWLRSNVLSNICHTLRVNWRSNWIDMQLRVKCSYYACMWNPWSIMDNKWMLYWWRGLLCNPVPQKTIGDTFRWIEVYLNNMANMGWMWNMMLHVESGGLGDNMWMLYWQWWWNVIKFHETYVICSGELVVYLNRMTLQVKCKPLYCSGIHGELWTACEAVLMVEFDYVIKCSGTICDAFWVNWSLFG